MITKILEIRDEGTRVDVIAIRMVAHGPIQGHYLNSHGYPHDGSSVGIVRLSDWKGTNDLYDWAGLGTGTRTMQNAHQYIYDHFDELKEGDVVDVSFILGETDKPKLPEREDWATA